MSNTDLGQGLSEVERIQAKIEHTQRLLSADITELTARANPSEYSRKLKRFGKTAAIVGSSALGVLLAARVFRRR
ncbi:MAG: DUF3618 domain-containing protein [Pseudoclavibacter sp.]